MLSRFAFVIIGLLGLAGGLVLSPQARANIITFDHGVINPNVEPCGGCTTGEVQSYTEDGIVAYSYFLPFSNLLVPSSFGGDGLLCCGGGVSGNLQITAIALVSGGKFSVGTFDWSGALFGSLLGFQGDTQVAGDLLSGLGCNPCGELNGNPAWQNLTAIELGGADPTGYLDNLVLNPASTPLPATLPLFATGLGGLGLFGWRRKLKLKACAVAA